MCRPKRRRRRNRHATVAGVSRSETDRHPLLEPVAFLLGTWAGDGAGLWAGGFDFEDSLEFHHDGRPMIEFRQATRTREGRPSHGEAGYLLAREGGVVHLTVAEPSGITETLTGRAGDGRITLESVEIGHAPGTSRVTRTARRFRMDGDTLVAEVDIAVNDEALAPHTRSVLHRSVASDA